MKGECMGMLNLERRPRRFQDVYGQAATKRLMEMVVSGNPSSAILLSGSTGVGKTSSAYVLARALTCRKPLPDGNPCNECENCVDSLNEKWTRDLVILDSAKVLKKGDLLELEEFVDYLPLHSPRKVMVIEEVQSLTAGNRDTLLKLLEMKQNHAVMILTTTDPQKLGTVITSRTDHYRFRRPGTTQIATFLKEYMEKDIHGAHEAGDPAMSSIFDGVPPEFFGEPLFALADVSDGSYRQAIQYLSRCVEGGIYTTEGIVAEFESITQKQMLNQLQGLLEANPAVLPDIRNAVSPFFFKSLATLMSCKQWALMGSIEDGEFLTEWFRGFLRNPQRLNALLRVYQEVLTRPWNEDAFMLSLYVYMEDQRRPAVPGVTLRQPVPIRTRGQA
jgi:DNA polymerase III delta prime subunit